MAVTITATQKFDTFVYAVDAKGNPATLEGDPVWSSSDVNILMVTPVQAQPTYASVVAVGVAGTAQVMVSADADLGEGVRTLTATLDVTVIGGEAVSLLISPSVITEQ